MANVSYRDGSLARQKKPTNKWHVLHSCKFYVFFVVAFPFVIASVMSIVCWICVLDHSARLRHCQLSLAHSLLILFASQPNNNRNNCYFLPSLCLIAKSVCSYFIRDFLPLCQCCKWNTFGILLASDHFGCCVLWNSFSLIYTCIHCNLLIFFANARETSEISTFKNCSRWRVRARPYANRSFHTTIQWIFECCC